MKKRFTLFLVIGLMALGIVAQDREHMLRLGDFMKPKAGAGFLNQNGTVPLTADWNVGAFDLTCVDMNATNFKLSGTGTLTSALGNISLTTALTAASGNEAALTLNYTTNKAAGNDTGLVVNQTDTASPGTSLLADFQVATVSKFSVTNAGAATFASTISAGGAISIGSSVTLNLDGLYRNIANGTLWYPNSNLNGYYISKADTNSTGSPYVFAIKPTYNQTSTAAATDLLIDRTETAVGSGAQNLIDAQVGSTSRFRISNKGFETRKYPLACTHDTATALFGIVVTAGNTAGGIITYTLNVTDDDGSDDQIEIGTVQFVGLQDEANWHTNIAEVSTQAAESGTLATTWAIDTATANTLKVTLQATSNLTSPVYTLSYTVTWNNAYTVTTY